jgi:hypothetical protein
LFRIDLHVHSFFSGDSNADPEEAVVRAIEKGLDGIVFTEHYFFGVSEPVEVLKEKYGDKIRIFRGVEFPSYEGHCLVYGADTDKLLLKHVPVDELIRVVHNAGGVVIPSHPYRRGTSLGELIRSVKGICALEGYNGCNMPVMNDQAVAVAMELNLPYTGGSDAHLPSEVGLCFTGFQEVVTYDNFIDLLKAGKYQGVDTRRHVRKTGLFGAFPR